jgi:hypothetical protein
MIQEAGWASELVWTQRIEEKFLVSAGDRTPVVQSIVTHRTDLRSCKTITTKLSLKKKRSEWEGGSGYHFFPSHSALII